MPRRPPPSSQRQQSPAELSGEESDQSEIRGRGEGSATEREASNIVRLALFSEARKGFLRRDEIIKKALSNGSRTFSDSFARAQQILDNTFGMELVEVMSKAAREAQINDDDDKDASAAKKKAPASSKAYVLRSKLEPALIDAANAFDDDIRLVENDHPRVLYGDNDDVELEQGGAILAWQMSDHLGMMGLLSTVLAMIFVNGDAFDDHEMHGFLKSLRLPARAKLPFNTNYVDNGKSALIEEFLSIMMRQGYLEKVKTHSLGITNGVSANPVKRGRASMGGKPGEDGDFEWKWGARAYEEFSQDSMAEFVTNLMVEKNDLIDEEDEEGGTPSDGNRGRYMARKEEEFVKMKESVSKAARPQPSA